MRSWSVFEGPIRLALHQIKYRRNLALGDALACQLFPYVQSLGWQIDLVVPVPLGKKRIQQRGYNQVGLVALPLAARSGWEYCPKALSRTRETCSQVGLSIRERKENVRDAFGSEPAKVSDKSVLLIDDVATTGATISACAKALLDSGAREVFAFTLSRALPHHGLKIV